MNCLEQVTGIRKPLICLLGLLLRRCLKVLGNGCYAPIEWKQLLNSEMCPEAGLVPVPVTREQLQPRPVASHRQVPGPPALSRVNLGLGNCVQQGACNNKYVHFPRT